jgi:hypothetical protein
MITTTKTYKFKDLKVSMDEERLISRMAAQKSISYLEAKERLFSNSLLNY